MGAGCGALAKREILGANFYEAESEGGPCRGTARGADRYVYAASPGGVDAGGEEGVEKEAAQRSLEKKRSD